MAYHTTKHAKRLNLAHRILVCKYGLKLLIPFGDGIKSILRDIAGAKRIHILEMEVGKVPIHLLIDDPPTKSLTQIVSLFKQVTTYRMWRIDNIRRYLQRCFWKEHTFWSDGTFACSIGNANPETIRQYIQNQG
jgi:putative transposase